MKRIVYVTLLYVLCSLPMFVSGQSSYWVTTDAGTQKEVFPVNSTILSSSTGSISTIFASNNGGIDGGAIYFNITVGNVPVSISAFDINTEDFGALTLSAYIFEGSYVGNEGNSTIWGTPVTGTGTGAGTNNPTHVTLGEHIQLNANTSYGIALVLDVSHSWEYTNGNGTNQNYSNGDLSLSFGSATNSPFSGSVNSPRVWNGTIYYSLGSAVPVSSWFIIIAMLLISATVVFRFRRRAKMA